MAYILNKTNGSIIATVQDATVDTTTDLSFVGRNYAGYGEIQNENFLKLLENFANSTAPLKPIEGQIWYDTVGKHLTFFNTVNWKGIPSLEISSTNPIDTTTPVQGDLWYNSSEQQLSVFNGSQYVIIGPPIGADTKAGWRGDFEKEGNNPIYNTKAVIGEDVIATVSAQSYTLSDLANSSYPIYNTGSKLYKGINLTGADPSTGSSESSGAYFWGTAAHALRANTSTYSNGFVTSIDNTTNSYKPVTFLTTSTSVTDGTISIDYGFTYNPSTHYVKATRFEGVATSALYADLAERYEADAIYEYGTVLVISGEKEVTISTIYADTRVAGIVSKNPAYMMNSEAGSDETHPYIALKGRVPCRVIGTINKGDLLVTSDTPGHATVWQGGSAPDGTVIAKALENNLEGFGVIEVLVV